MRKNMLGASVTTLIVIAALALVAWFGFAAATGATLVIFRTGSMTPAIPQGSLAVSLPVAASEIAVGDVVTVQREPGTLPVSHRVVEVRAPGAGAGLAAETADSPGAERELILQGDANATVDTHPYVVRDARRVVASLPGLGTALTLMQTPLGLGLLVILAGGLTTWAFWPRSPASPAGSPAVDRSDAPADPPERAGAAGAHAEAAV
ncbi:signal peptidase [Leucobacter luti]|uniref:signal peptidase I n=1 Tax=Leucobacter luti TaxID=340320 RepID=UPI0010D3412F|nr:signal peptidase I [Leucobacter luti]MCW2289642.1 signal peptidase [Leucobacter luti]TCK37813.1 signal peptidase [Leucobacter luti]